MATLQKIRSKGPLLVVVIGLALFAFIAGDAWKVLQPHQGAQDAGEVDGEVLSAQDYQKMVDEYSEIIKMSNGLTSLNDAQMNNVKDQVWQTYVNNKLIANEAAKLGLKVTKAEIQDIINEGTHPLLMQTPFRNPQTGAFDNDMLKKFLVDYSNMAMTNMPTQYAEYYQTMWNYWKFIEKTLIESTLADKYQSLISNSIISNPVATETSFNSRTNMTSMVLAGIPYSSINDSTITVSDNEVKALYNKRKEEFKQLIETRDINYIDVRVLPSDADRKAVLDEVTEYSEQLKNAQNYATFIRSTGSTINYVDVPMSESVLPADVKAHLAETKEGEVYGPYYNQSDDSYNAFKLVSKVSAPDSIRYRQIQVVAENSVRTIELADSIYKAINGGAKFEEIAKIYGQTGEATTLAASNWEHSQLNIEDAKYVNTLISQPVNTVSKVTIGQASIILQVLKKIDMKPKYKVAVIKSPVEFSKETYNAAYNKISQFVAQNTTLEDMVANASESGYTIMPRRDLSSAEHYVGGVSSTREALKWVFAAKPGEVSPLYECGENDHLLVVGLEKINKVGYRDINSVANMLRAEIRRDKKADKIMASLKGKSFDQIKAEKNAVNDSIKLVTFSAPAYISATSASEPAISAAAAKTAVNKTSSLIKGNAGVYMIQVFAKDKGAEKYDAAQEGITLNNMSERFASQFINDLYMKGNVVDNRYLFF